MFPDRQIDWKSAPRVILNLFSVFSAPSVRTGLLNAWERRTLVRHVFFREVLSLARSSSVFSVPSVRTLFLIFGTNENLGIAPSQKEKALTPRCPFCTKTCQLKKLAFPDVLRERPTGSRPYELSSIFSLCSLCPLCEPFF